MNKKIFTLLLVALLGWQIASAQWNSNAAENTRYTDLTGEQVIPKIAVCTDGFAYIAWFSNHTGNYNVYLQRIDKDGNPQWPNNGILVSDNTQDSWLTDWDMSVDAENCALLVFSDIRTGTLNPFGYRVSPAGEMLWGEDGVALSSSTNFEPTPKVCGTQAGNAVFAWISSGTKSEVHFQKVSPDGTKLWGDGIFLVSTTIGYNYPFLMPADGDNVYLIYHKETGPFYAPNRGTYVQKLDANGNNVWANEAEIVAPVPMGIVISLQMCPDDAGGIVFAWYRNDVGTHFNCFVQHMDDQGNKTMPAAGVTVSTSMERNHMYPAPAFLDATQEIMIYFSEQDLNQNQRGLYAQKFDLAGNLLWGDEGKMLIPLSNNDYSLPAASGLHDRAICIFEEGNTSNVQATMLDSDGNYVWPQQFVNMCTTSSSKIHREMSPYYFGQWFAAWEDDRNGSTNIYAQNIQPDGSLGMVVTGIGENQLTEGFSVSTTPNPFTDKVVFAFDNFDSKKIAVQIFDITGKLLTTNFTNKTSFTFDADGLKPGMYYYRVSAGDEVFNGKIIKQ
jgi:hypothetical protein